MTKFGLAEFRVMRKQAVESAPPDMITTLRGLFKEQLVQNKDPNFPHYDQIEQFLLLSQDKSDLDLVLDVFKVHKQKAMIQENLTFGEKYIKMCLILNAQEKIFELVDPHKVCLFLKRVFLNYLN